MSLESYFRVMAQNEPVPGQNEQLERPRVTQVPPQDQQQRTARTGRKMGGVDTGTVALAMSGMSFYWTMPMMMQMARKQKKRKPKPAASPVADSRQADSSDAPYS